MSFQVMAWARSIKTGSATTKAVLMAVANYADEAGLCWPSQDQIADDTELSRHSVMRALDVLQELGLLTRERRHRKDGSRTSDMITLDLSITHLCSAEQRSTEQRNAPLRSTQQQPKSHSATAEPVRESPIRGNAREDADKAVAEWNAMASEIGLPKVQRITDQRAKRLAARLRDCGGLEGWQIAMGKIRGSPLCRGELGDWKADFDFVLQESSFVKLMEGKYDGNRNGSGGTSGSRASPGQAMRDAFDDLDGHIAERRAAAGQR